MENNKKNNNKNKINIIYPKKDSYEERISEYKREFEKSLKEIEKRNKR
jgi:hypothetical protein